MVKINNACDMKQKFKGIENTSPGTALYFINPSWTRADSIRLSYDN
jgi:hypothetical protein